MKTIEYFYSTHSAYAYLGSARLQQIAAQHTRRIVHRPFDLRRLFAAAGRGPVGSTTDAHRAYFFGREITRWAHRRRRPGPLRTG